MEDEDTLPAWYEIIAQLCLEVGRIMEDTSGQLASVPPKDHNARATWLRDVGEAGDDIQALLAAAQVLHRRR